MPRKPCVLAVVLVASTLAACGGDGDTTTQQANAPRAAREADLHAADGPTRQRSATAEPRVGAGSVSPRKPAPPADLAPTHRRDRKADTGWKKASSPLKAGNILAGPPTGQPERPDLPPDVERLLRSSEADAPGGPRPTNPDLSPEIEELISQSGRGQ